MRNSHVRYLRPLGILLVAGLAPLASGQDAVGNGRALEHRLKVPQPGAAAASTRTFSQELLFREAVVTGTAPGGFSFRGETLPSQFEFRGELGEDTLFAYRRDSLYSGLSGRGIRGVEALQYQFALSVGENVPPTLAGPVSFARAGEAERGLDLYRPYSRDLSAIDRHLHRATPKTDETLLQAVDASAPLILPMRSVSSYTSNRGLQPTLVGLLQSRETQQTSGQTASPLLGVQLVPVETLRNPYPLNADPSRVDPLTQPQVGQPATSRQPRTAYDDMMDRYREASGLVDPNAEDPTGSVPGWARDLVAVRRTLRGLPNSTAKAMGLTPEAAAPDPNAPVTGRPENPLLDGTTNPDAVPTFDAEVLRRIREAGGLANTLIATDLPEVNLYAAHMRGGEEMLRKNRYFDAEERFISAMSAKPGDVNAEIGRIHAQIGAGLYLSAALNIRQLFVDNPETSGMRYGAALLPEPERLEQVIPALRAGLRSLTSGADSGLVLAYLGHQLGQPDDVRDGLAALREQGDDAGKRLADLLEAVWLEAAPPTGDDSPADGG